MRQAKLEHVMSYNALLAPAEIIGPLPESLRINFYVTSGTVTGPGLSGKVRPVGGDWLTLRRDGIAVLDVRATLELAGGALVYVTYGGFIDLGETGYDDFQRGIMPPSGIAIRIQPRLHTTHPDYLWLNRLFCVGTGQAFLDRQEVEYDVFAVR